LSEIPAHLSESSKALWREILAEEASSGRKALVLAGLEARDRAEQARVLLEQQGLISTTEETGAMHVNPLVKIESDNRRIFAQIWAKLGLDFGLED
jgi:P27 family predicted phage terminase small subunit